VARVFADLVHRLDERAIFAVGVLAFVAGEIPARPTVDEAVVRARHAERPDAVALAAVGRGAHRSEREFLESEADDAHTHDRHDERGGHVEALAPARRVAEHLLFACLGDARRGALEAHEPGDGHEHFVDADHHQHVPHEVQKRQDARVPQEPDDRQALARHEHADCENHRVDAEPRRHRAAPPQRRGEPHQGETGDDHVEHDVQREEHVDERLGVAGGHRLVFHVGHVGVVEHERHHPERRQQDRGADHPQTVLPLCGLAVHRENQHVTEEGKEQHDAVRQRSERKQHRGRHPHAAGLERADEHAEAEHAERERDGERELPRHRRGDVAAVNRETLVEEKHRAGHHEQLRQREGEPRQARKEPRAHGQGEEARHRHELQRDAVRQHDVENEDEDCRHHHVEAVDRQTGVPVVAPAGEPQRREQVVAQIRRAVDVGAHVAAGRCVVAEDERWLQREEHHQRGEKDDAGGDEQLRAPLEVHEVARGHGTARRAPRRVARGIGGGLVSHRRVLLGEREKRKARGVEG